MKNAIAGLMLVVFVAAVSACATIVGNPNQDVPIASTPSAADIRVTDEQGKETFKGSTPITVTLPKSDGHYFGKKTYTVTITKPGYQPQTIPVLSSPNGWYFFGNLVFGGLIGWFIVDPLNGGMYNLSPEQIKADLPAATTHNNKATDGSITIMLIEDVPAELRGKMKRIN
jgi:hypothetical protein